jgi:hypothetical protein
VIKSPNRPSFLLNNLKRELKTIGKIRIDYILRLERNNEINFENRILLRKMLQIDIKPSNLNAENLEATIKSTKAIPTTNGLNSYNSLNRAVRIKKLSNIIDSNKIMLRKLQDANSHYSIREWDKNDVERQRLKHMLAKNSDRFCKNPYFLHSICTSDQSNFQTLCIFIIHNETIYRIE